MTGFARCQGQDSGHDWTWELKSVNHRGFDLRCRLGQGNDSLEPELRRRLVERIARGSVGVGLVVRRAEGAVPVRINRPLLEELVTVSRSLADDLALTPPSLDGLLALPGVIEPVAEDDAAGVARRTAMLASFDAAVAALAATRGEEGARLEVVLVGLLDEIAAAAEAAAAAAAAQPSALRARLEAQLDELLADASLSQERLVQEVALLAAKADVREEIERLRSHVEAARALLGEGGAVGRRLDFLCQELNREANTVCAKSADVELTTAGLALKAAIDRLREQVQNIE